MLDEPVNAASVALVHSGRVLLIQRAFPPYAGLWTLPGGRIDPGESAQDCARREMAEELGLVVEELAPCTVLDADDGAYRLQVFACSQFSGTIRASDEIAGYRWAAPDEVRGIETTPGLKLVLQQAFELAPPAAR